MKYYFRDPLAKIIELDNLHALKKILSNKPEFWEEGSGDSIIRLANKEYLIIFKVENGGLFIDYTARSSCPLIKPNTKAKTIEHYIGGEPMNIPDICLCDEETGFKIISYFIEHNGELHPEFEWTHRSRHISLS